MAPSASGCGVSDLEDGIGPRLQVAYDSDEIAETKEGLALSGGVRDVQRGWYH